MANITIYPEFDSRYELPRSEVCGGTKDISKILGQLAVRNCETRVGDLDYNAYGVRGHKMEQLTEPFVDNFCVSFPVSESQLEKVPSKSGLRQVRKNKLCDVQNSLLRQTLRLFGLEAPTNHVKAQGSKLGKNRQQFKVACHDEKMEDVLAMLNDPTFYQQGMELDDVDITIDYAGSFKRAEVRDHMLANHGFRMENSNSARRKMTKVADRAIGPDADSTVQDFDGEEESECTGIILRNTDCVGANCLTYMETYKGGSVRNKIYNKFVQSLESASVRGSFGNHLWDWCNNPGSRLREAISRCLPHGLTRIEATFYGRVPTVDDAHHILSKWVRDFLPPNLCISSPIESQWKALAEKVHSTSIFYCKESRDILLAYWTNQYTRKVGGIYKKIEEEEDGGVHNLERSLLWMASELTFDKPVHIYYLSLLSIDEEKDTLTCGARSFRKIGHGETKDIRTRIVEGGCMHKSMAGPRKGTTLPHAKPSERGIPPCNGIEFYIATEKTNLSSRRRYHFADSDIFVKPTLIADSIAANGQACNAAAIEERRKYMDRKTEQRQKNWAMQLYLRLAEEETAVRKKAMYEGLYQTRSKRFEKDDVGKSFVVSAIGTCSGRYGSYYVLLTDKGTFTADFQSADRIPNILELLTKETQNGRTIHSLGGMEIYTIEVGAWVLSANRNYYAKTRLVASATLRGLDSGDILAMPEPASLPPKSVPESQTLCQIPWFGKNKLLVRLESLAVGTAIEVVGMCSQKINGREVDIYLGADGKHYRGSYFSTREVAQAAPKERFSIVMGGLRITPTKKKEMSVAIVRSEEC